MDEKSARGMAVQALSHIGMPGWVELLYQCYIRQGSDLLRILKYGRPEWDKYVELERVCCAILRAYEMGIEQGKRLPPPGV